MVLTENEWKEWKNHPVTKEWFDFLEVLEQQVKNDWAKSYYVGDTFDETVQRNAAAIGQVDLLQKLQDTTIENIIEESYDAKH